MGPGCLLLLLPQPPSSRYNGIMKRRFALLTIGTVILLPTVGLEPLGVSVRRNDPADWHRWWWSSITHVHPTYPREGRETISRRYERSARTAPVGSYLDVTACLWGEPYRGTYHDLPDDFNDYLIRSEE